VILTEEHPPTEVQRLIIKESLDACRSYTTTDGLRVVVIQRGVQRVLYAIRLGGVTTDEIYDLRTRFMGFGSVEVQPLPGGVCIYEEVRREDEESERAGGTPFLQ